LYVGEPKDSNLKSITHIDGTCRFQTVDNTNKYFYNLIKEFYKLSGCPLLLNTSFNINGKPILASTEDAINFYNKSEIDCLVVGDKIYNKKGR
jgi:carbamoyltransferase